VLPDAVAVYDREGRVQHVNAAWHTLMGFAQQPDYTSRPLTERVTRLAVRDAADDPLPYPDWPVARLLRGETLSAAQARDLLVRTLDGHDVVLNYTGTPLHNRVGELVGAVAVARDVTEQRRLERRTREALSALLALAEALVLPVENGVHDELVRPIPIAQRLAELITRILGCQRLGLVAIAPEMRMLQPLAVVGLPTDLEAQWWADLSQARLDEHFPPAIIARLQAGETVLVDASEPFYRERPHIDRDSDAGGVMLMAPLCLDDHCIGYLELDYGGADHAYRPEDIALATAAAQVATLVLEREQLQRVREGIARLAERERLQADVIAAVSHSLRTPLTAVHAGLRLLEATLGGRLEPEEREVLQAARRNAVRLRVQVDDLLAANRLDGGMLRPGQTTLDLRAAVKGAQEDVQPLLQEKGQELVADLPLPLPVVGDAQWLQHVVVNLLVNAHQHTPPGTRITVSGLVRADAVCLSVSDTGPGIPDGNLEAIFARFHRLSTLSGGAGLGLAIARGIVELHGGQLWAENRHGGGAAFYITLPHLVAC
jgi:signal transduction histidine kinase